MEFGDRLKKLRLERNMSLEELAEQLNITKSAISKYERNIVIPSLKVAKDCAVFFGVTLDYIAGVNEDENRYIPPKYMSMIDKCMENKISAEKIERIIDALVV